MGWIASGGCRLDGAAFDDRVRRAASVIAGRGLHSGDGIALYLRNDLAYFEASFGAAILGVYPVPVNWHYTPDEAGYLLRDSGVKLLVIHADLLPAIREAVPEGLAVIVVETPPEIRTPYGLDDAPLPAGLSVWRTLCDAAPPFAASGEGVGEPAPIAVIYTSGTTGRPKSAPRWKSSG